MGSSIVRAALETEGNRDAAIFHGEPELENAGKSAAILALNDVINASGVQRKVLAAECGWSDAQFSKVASGVQGDLLDLVYRLPKHRANLRAEFFARLGEQEHVDPLAVATEQMVIAALRVLRLHRGASRMAKASHGEGARRERIA